MALTTAMRQLLRKEYGSRLSERRELFNLTKAQLDATIAAIDSWIETNQVSFNTSIPEPMRNMLTTLQKAELFFLVALKRYG